MSIRLSHWFWVVLLVSVSVMLYHTSYRVQVAERQIAAARAQRAVEMERIHVLEAEWAALTAPARLQRLAGKFMPLQPLATAQVVAPHKLARVLPLRTTDDLTIAANDADDTKFALAMTRLLTER